jgi:predicted CXXCH cytochrome family protein
MRRFDIFFLVIFILMSSLSISSSGEPVQKGRDVISIKMGAEVLSFTHRKHQALTKNECWHCHKTENGKIDDWNKDTAHNLCISCHDLDDKGPVECRQCHIGNVKTE